MKCFGYNKIERGVLASILQNNSFSFLRDATGSCLSFVVMLFFFFQTLKPPQALNQQSNPICS